MSRTLLPRGALSAYSAAVDHVLRVDESTCRVEGVRISSGSFIPPILVGWFRPGGPRRRSRRLSDAGDANSVVASASLAYRFAD